MVMMMSRPEADTNGLLVDTSLRSSLLSLVDAAVSDLAPRWPCAPVKVVAALQRGIEKRAKEYYEAVVREFEMFLHELQHDGFSPAHEHKASFAWPDRDGSMIELFPNGIYVNVTAGNYRYFLHLVHNLRQNVPTPLRDLPIDPKLHICGNYYPVASFIVDYLLNSESEWYIDNEEDWDALHVTYNVPFNDQLLDVFPWIQQKSVPYCNAKEFGMNAKSILQQLEETFPDSESSSTSIPYSQPKEESHHHHHHSLSLMSRGYLDFLHELRRANTPLGSPLSREEFNTLHLTYSIPVGNTFVPLIPGGESERVALKDKDLFVSLASQKLMESLKTTMKVPPSTKPHVCNHSTPMHTPMDETTPLEKNFWLTVENIKKKPPKTSSLCFAIKVLGNDVLLKENGDTIGVTEDNVTEYVDLLYQERDMIHAAFLKNEVRDTEICLMSSTHPSQPLPLPSSSLCNTRMIKSLQRYPPQNSPLWNSFVLEPTDVGNEIFQMLKTMPFNDSKISQKEHVMNRFFFAIPIRGKGLYKLIPDGDNIPVTLSNCNEFMERLQYEKERLHLMTSFNWKHSFSVPQQETGTASFQSMCSPCGYSRNSVMEALDYMLCQEKTSHDLSTGSLKATTKATLDEIDMYKKNLRSLQRDKDRVSLKMFEDLGLRYTLTVAGEEVALVKKGQERFVTVQELDTYVDMAISKLDEIRCYILKQNDVCEHNKYQPKYTTNVFSCFSPQCFQAKALSPTRGVSLWDP